MYAQSVQYLSVVSHRCDILCHLKEVTQMESVWEQDVRKLLGFTRNDVTVEWRKLHNVELHDL
jgi:hypothetical protein